MTIGFHWVTDTTTSLDVYSYAWASTELEDLTRQGTRASEFAMFRRFSRHYDVLFAMYGAQYVFKTVALLQTYFWTLGHVLILIMFQK